MAERPLRTTLAGLAGAVLTAALLTSCGSGASYCSTLKAEQPQLKRLSAQVAKPGAAGSHALDQTVTVLDGLRSTAPDDISADWDTLVQALGGLRDAVRASGAAPGDFAAGKRPTGVTQGQYNAVTQAAAELQATPVQQSSASVEQHAQDVCKVDLGAGLGGL